MKYALVLLALSLPIISQAEFRPGRQRVTASAQMEIVSANGVYTNAKDATLSTVATDGSPVAGYVVEIDGKVIKFPVAEITKQTKCGVTLSAVSLENMMGSTSSQLEVVDMSGAVCMKAIPFLWEKVTIVTVDYATDKTSTLVLRGNPEFFMSTM